MDVEIIKKNFDHYRQQKGLKIDEICKRLGGIARQSLYNYMKTGITLNTLSKIATSLDVEPWQLIKPQDEEGHEDPKPLEAICPHCGKPLQITIK